jgi:putative ABC transport system permease protein
MKYFKIIWKNLTRNRRRTILTVLSIGFSLFLITFLRTLIVEMTRINTTPMSIRRSVVRRSTSLGELMPESYRRKIEAVPDVEIVVAQNWFGGVYKEIKNFFANFAVDHDKFFEMFPERKFSDSARQDFLRLRSAAVCGVKLAERFGWKTGDKITLLGALYPVDLEFTLVGTYTSEAEENTFFFRRDYFEESLGKPGKVGIFTVASSTPEAVARVNQAIDAMFRNTDAETLTETEHAFAASFQGMMGNVQGLVVSISSVVVFMILLVVGNTMSMNIRERSHEIAILKSIGFQNESLIGMLVSEAVLICLMGGILGCFGAKILFSVVELPRVVIFIRGFDVSAATLALGIAISLVVGIVSGAIPAFHVARLTVADGLRRIG